MNTEMLAFARVFMKRCTSNLAWRQSLVDSKVFAQYSMTWSFVQPISDSNRNILGHNKNFTALLVDVSVIQNQQKRCLSLESRC